jgi:glycosyltransferase involved in cell wall biosynthesis
MVVTCDAASYTKVGMRKRCAILTSFDPYVFKGGIETYTRQMADALRRHGRMVDIYHTQFLPESTTPYSSPPSFHSPFLHKLSQVGRAFYRVDHLYDFVVAHAFFGFAYSPPRIPAFTVFHSTHAQYAEANRELFSQEWYFEVKHLFGLGAEQASTVGKKVIAVSDAVAHEVTQHYGARDVTTVLTGVDQTIFFPRLYKQELRDQFAIPRDAFVGVFLARWGADKAIDVLQQVMEATQKVFWVLILGTGEPCPLHGRPNTRIIENSERNEVAALLACADFLFHPSRYEGFGLAVAEALSCGLPVVAAPVGVACSLLAETPLQSLLLPSYREGKQQVINAAIDVISRLQNDAGFRRTCAQHGQCVATQSLSLSQWERNFLAALGLASENSTEQASLHQGGTVS